jgi:hypothetical protein
LSTLFAFFFSLAALASCRRIAFREALNYGIFFKDPSTSGVFAELDLLVGDLLPPGRFVLSEALNSIPKKTFPATQHFFSPCRSS